MPEEVWLNAASDRDLGRTENRAAWTLRLRLVQGAASHQRTAACLLTVAPWSQTLSVQVVDGFEAHHRGALLKFVTSCSRPPLGGFAHLSPPFTVHQACPLPAA